MFQGAGHACFKALDITRTTGHVYFKVLDTRTTWTCMFQGAWHACFKVLDTTRTTGHACFQVPGMHVSRYCRDTTRTTGHAYFRLLNMTLTSLLSTTMCQISGPQHYSKRLHLFTEHCIMTKVWRQSSGRCFSHCAQVHQVLVWVPKARYMFTSLYTSTILFFELQNFVCLSAVLLLGLCFLSVVEPTFNMVKNCGSGWSAKW